MLIKDTIVALATPPGRSGIGVIRLSGARALEIAQQFVQEKNFAPEPNRATLHPAQRPPRLARCDTFHLIAPPAVPVTRARRGATLCRPPRPALAQAGQGVTALG